MEKLVMATRQILSGERDVENVSYSKSDGKLMVWFAHAENTVAGETVKTSWEQIETLFPAISDLDFDRESDMLRFDVHDRCWKSV